MDDQIFFSHFQNNFVTITPDHGNYFEYLPAASQLHKHSWQWWTGGGKEFSFYSWLLIYNNHESSPVKVFSASLRVESLMPGQEDLLLVSMHEFVDV